MSIGFCIKPAGDSALLVQLGNKISPELNAKVRALNVALQHNPIEGVIETVPAYCSLLVCFDPLKLEPATLEKYLERAMESTCEGNISQATVTVIPVCYGGDLGPDLEFVSAYCKLAPEEVIALHSAPNYLIYMLGFTPGFPYLGGMDPRIATPRLENPRIKIPAGSVGIAGEQTGIYPVDSPGGWRIIGRTPVNIYDPFRTPPVLFSAGNYIRFQPITAEQYKTIKEQAKIGAYKVRTYNLEEEKGTL